MENKIFKMKKESNEKMSQAEAFEIIQGWGDDLEVRLIDEDFEEVQKEIWQAVALERLTFDPGDEVFAYALKKPIKDKDGLDVISIIKIHETDMNSKRGMSKHKDDIDTVAAMFQAYCKDSEGKEIPHGFLTRIKDRDQIIISAVVLGFFVQAVPSRKFER